MTDWNEIPATLRDRVFTQLEKQKFPDNVAPFQAAQSNSHHVCNTFWLNNIL